MKKFEKVKYLLSFEWCTKDYAYRIVVIVFTTVLFLIGNFLLFKSDETLTAGAIAYFSLTFALSGGFILAFLYWFIYITISKAKSKSQNENADVKKIKKPKYLSLDFWIEDYCHRIVGVVAIIIMIVLDAVIIWLAAELAHMPLNFITLWEVFSIFLPFDILFGVLIANIYETVAIAIATIYSKIKEMHCKHE